MINTKQWIALLNQQYSTLRNKGDLELLLATRMFVKFLENDPQSRRYVREMERRWDTSYKQWFDDCKRIRREILDLEGKIREIGSHIRKFIEDTEEIPDQDAFNRSKHILDKIEEHDWYQPWADESDDMNLDLLHFKDPSHTRTGHMASHVWGITKTLVNLARALRTEQQSTEKLNKEAEQIWRKYGSAQWKAKNDWMSSGRCALDQLRIAVKIMDGEIFTDLSILKQPSIQPLLPWVSLLVMYAPPDLKEDAKYWLRQPEAEYKDFAADLGPLIKDYLQQVHTDLIFTASSRLSHQLLVGRYKERCENYDWKNIADLIEEHVKKANQIAEEMGKSPRYEFEDLLTLHFARYLHDHGYSVHYTPRDGVHEPDLLGKLSNELEPIVVEAKVVGQIFGKQQGRDWIKNGLRALVAYLEKYHNDYGVIDGYIVVFRVGDETTPNFKFDQSEWTIGQFTINSTVINIGRINKKDPHIIIRREDFLQSYNSQNIG